MALEQRRRAVPALAYLERYNLRDMPFSTTASPRYAYALPTHIAAINTLRNVVLGRTALGICSGEVGLGKTTMARMVAEDLRVNDIPTVLLPAVPGGSRQSEAAFLRTLVDEFKLKRSAANAAASNYSTIAEFARANDDAGSTTVVIIDDAQELRSAGTRAILQLLALQTPESQLVQVILFGQNPELLRAVKSNPAIHSRLSAHVELTAFAEEEVEQMIAWRLKVAQRTQPLFTKEALHQLAVTTGGIPRKICRTANSACILACERDSDMVEVEDVASAAAQLLHTVDAA